MRAIFIKKVHDWVNCTYYDQKGVADYNPERWLNFKLTGYVSQVVRYFQ
jgi:hypothetical protein